MVVRKGLTVRSISPSTSNEAVCVPFMEVTFVFVHKALIANDDLPSGCA